MRFNRSLALITAVLLSACNAPQQGDTASSDAIIKGGSNPLCQILHTCNPRLSPSAAASAPIDSHLGRGWNVVDDSDAPTYGTCLGTITKTNLALSGATVRSSFEFISNTVDLHDKLDISARVSGAAPTGAVPVGGTVSGDLLRTADAHQDVITLMVHTEVTFTPQRMTTVPSVTQASLDLFDTSGSRAFRDKCGDRFVDQVTPGGEYTALIQISSSNSDTQSRIKSTLAASIGSNTSGGQALSTALSAANVSPSASLGSSGLVNTTVHNTAVQVRIQAVQRGGSDLSQAITVQDITNKFLAFPTSFHSISDTLVMGVHLAEYTTLPSFGTRQPFAVGSAINAVNLLLGPRYLHYLDVYNQLAFATSQSDLSMYFPFNMQAVADLRDEAAQKLLEVEAAVDACADGNACTVAGLTAQFPNNFAPLSALPVRRQLYVAGAQAFLDAVTQAGGGTSFDHDLTAGGACHIDQAAAPIGNFRIWTSRGLSGTTCHYALMTGASLRAPWQVAAMDRTMPLSSNQTLEHSPSASDLSLRLTQTSPLVSLNPDTTAIVNSFTLAGPMGDPAGEPWRQAIVH
ncbi:MAG: hypothetical protein U1E65_29375 [Myxococcota bacterium]